jgi:hypothetical protein
MEPTLIFGGFFLFDSVKSNCITGGPLMFDIKPIDDKTRKNVIHLMTESWGGPIVVTKGKIHSAENLPG